VIAVNENVVDYLVLQPYAHLTSLSDTVTSVLTRISSVTDVQEVASCLKTERLALVSIYLLQIWYASFVISCVGKQTQINVNDFTLHSNFISTWFATTCIGCVFLSASRSNSVCSSTRLCTARLQSSLHQVDVCTSLVFHGKIIAALGVKGPPHCSTHSARVRQARLRIRRSNILEQSTWHYTKRWIH